MKQFQWQLFCGLWSILSESIVMSAAGDLGGAVATLIIPKRHWPVSAATAFEHRPGLLHIYTVE